MTAAVLQLPTLLRTAPIPTGAVFWFGNRPLKIVRVEGDDPAAPVIVEEMTDVGVAYAGQLSLWSVDCVRRVMGRA